MANYQLVTICWKYAFWNTRFLTIYGLIMTFDLLTSKSKKFICITVSPCRPVDFGIVYTDHRWQSFDLFKTVNLAVWCSGSVLILINEVNPRRARLLLAWVIVSGFNPQCRTFTLVRNQPPRPTQPYIPPGSVNEDQLQWGRKRQVWFIPLADERR